jgi:predicted dithiol-disulfide oxidoreductase (DUF899 family)
MTQPRSFATVLLRPHEFQSSASRSAAVRGDGVEISVAINDRMKMRAAASRPAVKQQALWRVVDENAIGRSDEEASGWLVWRDSYFGGLFLKGKNSVTAALKEAIMLWDS